MSVLRVPVNVVLGRLVRGGVVITGGLEMIVAGEVFLADRTFYWYWRRCPFAVAMFLGKYFQTRAGVILVHVVKKPAVISVVYDETTGLKAALWRYCMMSDLAERVCTLFDHRECCSRCVFGLV